MLRCLTSAALLLLILPAEGSAQELEELLFQEEVVITAALKAQTIAEAPAIISVLSAQDLEDLGVTNLYEALSYVPGVTVIETYYGYSSVTFRGNLQTHYNNKSLLLIDGHPMYETVVGSYYLEQIPIGMIRRIEVLRGPGSVLYGTNAFAGIINVITKDFSDTQAFSLSGGGGSFSSVAGAGFAGGAAGSLQYLIGANYLDSKGYDFLVKVDETGAHDPPKETTYPGDEDAYENDFYNLMAKVRFGPVSASGLLFSTDKDKFGLNPVIAQTGERTVDGTAFDARWDTPIGEKAHLGLLGWYDQFAKEEHIERVAGTTIRQEYDGSKLGVEARVRYPLAEGLEFLGGGSYEQQKSGAYLFVDAAADTIHRLTAWRDDHDSYDLGAYGEFSWSPSDRLGLSAGLRLNNNKDYGTKLVPRAGIVARAMEQLYAKVLFGQAFRNPNFFEKYVQTVGTLYGDPELEPEKVSTVDIGFDWRVGRSSLRANYFWLQTDSLIGRVATQTVGESTFPKYGNGSGQTLNGIEGEIRGDLGASLGYFANISYTTGKDRETEEDLLFLAKVAGNIGATWRYSALLRASANVQFVGSRDGKTTGGEEFSLDGYALMNASLRVTPWKNIGFWLKARNLFDTEYTYPEYVRARIKEIPGGPGMSVLLGLAVTF